MPYMHVIRLRQELTQLVPRSRLVAGPGPQGKMAPGGLLWPVAVPCTISIALCHKTMARARGATGSSLGSWLESGMTGETKKPRK